MHQLNLKTGMFVSCHFASYQGAKKSLKLFVGCDGQTSSGFIPKQVIYVVGLFRFRLVYGQWTDPGWESCSRATWGILKYSLSLSFRTKASKRSRTCSTSGWRAGAMSEWEKPHERDLWRLKYCFISWCRSELQNPCVVSQTYPKHHEHMR